MRKGHHLKKHEAKSLFPLHLHLPQTFSPATSQVLPAPLSGQNEIANNEEICLEEVKRKKLSGWRILVIDDDTSMTKMIRRGLTYEGYRVEVASSGKEGLDLAREQAPDLVILDIMMPGLNGLEVLKLLRAADARLPILFLTAKDAPADQVRGLELGADDYVTKPFTFKVLLARIHALLRRQQIEAPALLRFSDLAIDVKSHAIFRGKREIVLSSLEFKILLEFMEHPRQVLSKETLLEQRG